MNAADNSDDDADYNDNGDNDDDDAIMITTMKASILMTIMSLKDSEYDVSLMETVGTMESSSLSLYCF